MARGRRCRQGPDRRRIPKKPDYPDIVRAIAAGKETCMEIKVVPGDIAEHRLGAIVVNLFEGVKQPGGATGAVDRVLGGGVSELIAEREIKGALGEMTLIHTLGRIGPRRVLVAGLGKRSSFSPDSVRRVAAESTRYLRRIGVDSFASIVHGAGVGGLDPEELGRAIAEGAVLGAYRFSKYKSDPGRRTFSRSPSSSSTRQVRCHREGGGVGSGRRRGRQPVP